MSQGVHLRKYGVAATIDFELYEVDGVDFRTDWTPAEGDVFMMRNEAGEEQVTNAGGGADLSTLVTDEGRGYSITLALEDMQTARVVVYLVDQAVKAFLDKVIIIETYGNASAMHAFDLDTASAAQSADNDTKLDTIITGVNVTSEANIDFGALKKTSLNAATPDLTAIATVIGALDNAAAAGAVTEADTLMQYLKQLINILIGGPGVVTFPAEAAPGNGVSLAEVIRAIHVDTDAIQGKLPATKFMGSSDGADDNGTLDTINTNAARLTAVRADVLTDWINDGRLDALLDAIKVVTDNLADAATTMVSGTVSHDETAASTTVFYSRDIIEATADHYNGRIVIFTSGALIYQATDITDYALDTGEGKFTVTALTEAPVDNVTFVIV